MKPADSFSQSADDESIHDAAATWLARRDGGFDAAKAAQFAENAQNFLARLPETPAAAAMLAEVDALCAARPKVVPFSIVWKSVAGLAAAACIALYVFTSKPAVDSANATYTTAAGNHQSISLPDGSTLVLNASSEVAVAFAQSERRVQLQHGEAHFYVAKDAARPFYVRAGAVTVRAVGTAFNVRRQSDGVEVLVTEGKVKVTRQDDATGSELNPMDLVAGERAVIDTVATSALAANSSPGNSGAVASIGQRAPRLMFKNTPLSEVVERFNRFSKIKMEIADPELAERAVGGNFDADNAESFFNLLSAAGDVRVERVSETQVRLHRAR
jgi:transmembrane sensor